MFSLTRLILVAYTQRPLTYVGIMKEIKRKSKIFLDLTAGCIPSLFSLPWKKCTFPFLNVGLGHVFGAESTSPPLDFGFRM